MTESQGWLIDDEDKDRFIEALEEKIIEQNEYIVELEMRVERLQSQLIISRTKH